MTDTTALGGSLKSLIMGVESPEQTKLVDGLLIEEFSADAPFIGLAYVNLIVLLSGLTCYAGVSPKPAIFYAFSAVIFLVLITLFSVNILPTLAEKFRKYLMSIAIIGYESTLIGILLLGYITPEPSNSIIIVSAIIGMSFISISLIARFNFVFVLSKLLVLFGCALYVYFSANDGISLLLFIAISLVLLMIINAIGYWVIKRNREAIWMRSELAILNKEADERNIQLAEALSEAAEARDRAEDNFDIRQKLLSYIGHDLRQPVNAADFILRELASNEDRPDQNDLIQNVNICVKSVKRMIEDILQLTHYNNENIEVVQEIFDLNVIFEQIIQEYSKRGTKANINIRYVPTRIKVRSDSVLVTRVIRNLFQNTIKHAKAQNLLLGVRRVDSHIEIWVVDDGRGLESTTAKSPPKSSASPSSLGLGLSISRQLAKACDARLTLVSKLGSGTCGRLRFLER